MGGFATLHFGFTYPQRAHSLLVAGCGYGAAPDKRAIFAEEADAAARNFEAQGMAKAAESYALGPTRVQFQNKDPRGWKEFADQLREHSTEGAALTMRGADRSTTPSVRTSTSTAREDSFQSSEVLLPTVLRIATDFCGAMKKAIKIGRATSSAIGFIAEPAWDRRMS